MRPLASFLALALVCAATPLHAEGDPFLRRTTTVRVVERTAPAVVSVTTEQHARGCESVPAVRGRSDLRPLLPGFLRAARAAVRAEPRLRRADRRAAPRAHERTRRHGRERIRVSLADGREFDAKLIGADPNNDIAVLEVETQDKLPWIEPGSSADLMVGEPVIAIGNPFGLSHTVTTGVISAVGRSVRTEERVYHGFLQTDASINPGNSGGPLLNAEGHLVAINTAVYNRAQGHRLRDPDRRRAPRRARADRSRRSVAVWLGIDLQDLDSGLASALELPSSAHGAVVSRVRESSPAERAGVKRGDVVTQIDGQPLESARGFFERLERTTRGQEIALTLVRNRETKKLPVRAEQIPAGYVNGLVSEMLGLALEPNPRGGYAITGVRAGSHAAQIGLRRGDVLLAIGGRSLSDPEALRRAVLALQGLPRALLVVARGNGRYHVAVPARVVSAGEPVARKRRHKPVDSLAGRRPAARAVRKER
jgi:serine protease Do